ncbi:MAG: BGTF surface domain-containing protein, partial [Halobaculum sp.]
ADFPPAFEIGRHASPVIVGFTIRGRPAVDAVETRGDFVLRNLTVVEPVRTAIEAHGTSGDWLAQNLTIVTNATAVGVGDTTGAWTIRDSTIEYRDGGERQVDPAIHAHGSSSAWTIRNTSVEGYLVGIEAEHTSGDWTLSGVAVRDTTVGVSAYRSTGDWTIRQSVFRNTTVSDNIDFLSAPLTEGVAVFADQTNGSWTIRNTRFNASSEVDISAVDAAVRGDARGNVWDGSTTPDEDACTGNVTCAGSPDGDPVGTPTPTGDEPNLYQTVVTAGDGKHPLAAGDGQVVAGRTNLSAGTEVVVTLRSTNGTTFGASRTTVVDDEGRFRAVFDLSSLAVGTGYDVFVERAGERLATVSGTLVDCIACTETDSGAAITTITSDGENVTVVAEPGQ